MLDNFLLYLAIGFFSGIISGMGIGGGAILIPALVILTNIPQINAQSINLIYFIPTAISALFVHVKKGNIEFKILPVLICCGVLMAVAGSFVATSLNPDFLRKIFGFFLLLVGLYEIFAKQKLDKIIEDDCNGN